MSDTAAAAVESYWPASTGRDDLQKNSQVRKNRRERERERECKKEIMRERECEREFLHKLENVKEKKEEEM